MCKVQSLPTSTTLKKITKKSLLQAYIATIEARVLSYTCTILSSLTISLPEIYLNV
jgi:hypothetical protein